MDHRQHRYFWFFHRDNLELVVKMLDGRIVNGRFWVFYGALSDVEYTLRVTDRVTGDVKAYDNPRRNPLRERRRERVLTPDGSRGEGVYPWRVRPTPPSSTRPAGIHNYLSKHGDQARRRRRLGGGPGRRPRPTPSACYRESRHTSHRK